MKNTLLMNELSALLTEAVPLTATPNELHSRGSELVRLTCALDGLPTELEMDEALERMFSAGVSHQAAREAFLDLRAVCNETLESIHGVSLIR